MRNVNNQGCHVQSRISLNNQAGYQVQSWRGLNNQAGVSGSVKNRSEQPSRGVRFSQRQV